MTIDALPVGAYLAWRYIDARRAIDRAQVYWDDGRVEAFEDGIGEELCRFTADQVDAARTAVDDVGLAQAGDRSLTDAHDTATLTYWWRGVGGQGTVVNAAYPVEQIAEIDRLEAKLATIEEEAGGWPLSADE